MPNKGSSTNHLAVYQQNYTVLLPRTAQKAQPNKMHNRNQSKLIPGSGGPCAPSGSEMDPTYSVAKGSLDGTGNQ